MSANPSADGEFHELPGPPPDLEARRQAFRAVMRKLLIGPNPDPKESESDEERADEAA